jgi:Tol biopolymer transport system component
MLIVRRFAAIALIVVIALGHARTGDARLAELQPELWGEGLISTELNELNSVFSPDGTELFWSIQMPDQSGVIVWSRLVNGKWSEPAVAPFSGRYTDWDPFFTPDGQKILYVSNRPKPGVETRNAQDYDIWMVTRSATGWSEPVNIGAPVNTPRPEYYPSIASDGTLYYSGLREGSQGFDIYRSRLVDGKYTEPENLGAEVNSRATEIDNYIAPDQSFLIFNSSGRPDDLGAGDLYISYQRDGKWTPAVHLPAAINSTAREYCPIGSPDGRWLYFTSKRWKYDGVPAGQIKVGEMHKTFGSVLNGGGNIYRIPIRDVIAATNGGTR